MRRYWAIVALLVAAVLLVTLAITYGLLNLGRPSQPTPEPIADAPPAPEVVAPETKRMLVAARYLAVGALLGEADVVSEPLEVGRIPAGAIPGSDDDDILGTAVRVPVDAGTPVLSTDLVHPGARGFLSLILSPGMRAVSVHIGPATRHAGLIDPGDRVDVIVTASAPSLEGFEVDELVPATGGARLSRTVFEDLRVLAIDRTVRPPAVGGEEPPDQRQEIATATLEVSPVQAPALVHAGREGELALVVRAARSAPDPAPPPSVAHLQGLLLPDARPASPPPPPPPPLMALPRTVTIYRPDSEAEVKFPDVGPPETTWTSTRIPSPAASLSGPAPGGAVMIPGAGILSTFTPAGAAGRPVSARTRGTPRP